MGVALPALPAALGGFLTSGGGPGGGLGPPLPVGHCEEEGGGPPSGRPTSRHCILEGAPGPPLLERGSEPTSDLAGKPFGCQWQEGALPRPPLPRLCPDIGATMAGERGGGGALLGGGGSAVVIYIYIYSINK